ncbi:uncharacterized protein LOC134748501 [Cydia strobilella]|uniref:uncharacterized protein LOC134748501 n=1 Tax=Cydia strobilella TaxID=1100964 RepID=UPI003004A79D
MGKSETRVKRASKYCIAAGCFNNDKNSDCTFFAVPSGQSEEEVERCKKWLTLLGREDLLGKDNLKIRSYCVCCAHFGDSQIKMLKTLKRGAIPTLLLADEIQEGSSSTEANTGSSSTQTTSQVKDSEPLVSSENTEVAVTNVIIVKTEILSAEEALANSSENTESDVSNVIIVKSEFVSAEEGLPNSSENTESDVSNVAIVKSEFVSAEEAMEKSTQTPKGLKKRKLTDEPRKKCKKQKGKNSK